jgi:hypothetical protein
MNVDASNAFPKLLSELREGVVQNEASEKLTELVRKVTEMCRPGQMTIKLTISPASGGRVMTITDEIAVKLPKADKEATLLFATEGGLLQRDNPQQRSLEFRTVPTPETQEPKETAKTEPKQLKAIAG